MSITLLYPVINFPLAQNADAILLLWVFGCVSGTPECEAKLAHAVKHGGQLKRWLLLHRRELISFASAVTVVGLDVSVVDLASLFGLCGSIGLGTVSLIMPALMFLRQCYWKRRTASGGNIVGAVLVLMIGSVVTVGTTTVILSRL